MTKETVFSYTAPALESGPGAADEICRHLQQYEVRRMLVVTTPQQVTELDVAAILRASRELW